MAKSNCSIIKKHYIIAFFVSLTISLGLLVTSFFLPPTGEISPSVLQAAGEIFAWPVLAFGAKALEEGRTARIQKGSTTITVGKSEEEDGDNTTQEIPEG